MNLAKIEIQWRDGTQETIKVVHEERQTLQTHLVDGWITLLGEDGTTHRINLSHVRSLRYVPELEERQA